MNVWKVIFATALIFGAGVIVGGLLVGYAGHSAVNFHSSLNFSSAPKTKTSSAAGARTNGVSKTALPEVLSTRFVDMLETNLNLSLRQRADIEKLIANSQNDMRKAFQEERHNAREKIHTVLNPAQTKKFDELLQQHAARRARQNATNAPAAEAPKTN